MLASEMTKAELLEEVTALRERVAALEQKEEALRESEGRLRAILGNVADGVVIIDEQGRIESLNRAVEDFLGYSESETLGRNVRLLMSSEEAERHDGYIRRYLETGESRILGVGPREVMARRQDGVEIEMELVISEVWLGGARKFIGVLRDIGQRKEAERRATTAEARLKDAIDALPVGFQWFDADDRLILFNNATLQEFGAPLAIGDRFEDVVRRNVATGLLLDAIGREEEFVAERLATHRGQVGPSELRLSGDRWWLVSEHRMPDGSHVRINTDITELKRNQRALFEAKQTAEQADLAKSKFLAAASHDLRQPLQALILMLRLLDSRVGDAKTSELVADARGALDIMARLLNALLDMSKLDAGLVVPDVGPLNMGTLLKRLVRQFAPQAAEAGIDLRLVAPDRWVRSDIGLLERIIENLLANAIRYTEGGGRVLLGCRRSDDVLRVEVWDSGIGIGADHLQEIFSEFHQIGNAERNLTRGLGLGLAIVDRLASLLGHRIDVRSEPGRGSVFSVELPIAEAAADAGDEAAASVADLPLLAGLTALVIEDDDAIRRAMVMVLEDLNLNVWQARSGSEARSLLHRTGQPPDVIFADYRLSEGTWGHQVIAEVRRRFDCKIAAAIITGDTAPSEISAIQASGCHLLYKPVDLNAIVEVLQAALQARPS